MDNNNMTLLELAKLYVIWRHDGQLYNGYPYIYHLAEVAGTVVKYNNNKEVLVIAWLHDVLEDTKATELELSILFNERIANQVVLLSKNYSNNSSKDYITRCFSTYETALVKLCDRYCNVFNLVQKEGYIHKPLLLERYTQEQPLLESLLSDVIDSYQQWYSLSEVNLKIKCLLNKGNELYNNSL